MWLGPVLFVGVSIGLWRYLGAIFMPELMARSVFRLVPALMDAELVIVVNLALFYFSVYVLFAMFWPELRRYFATPYVATIILWLVNVLVLLPILGRGMLGYRLPQGWMAVSLPLFVAHWVYARGLQFQERRKLRRLPRSSA